MRRLKLALFGVLAAAIALLIWQLPLKLQLAALLGSLLLYLVPIILLPLIFYVLLRFAYRMFARPYLRLLRMRRYRNNKELMDAVRRGQ